MTFVADAAEDLELELRGYMAFAGRHVGWQYGVEIHAGGDEIVVETDDRYLHSELHGAGFDIGSVDETGPGQFRFTVTGYDGRASFADCAE